MWKWWKRKKPETPAPNKSADRFVVCETVHAICLHVREGQYQKCGRQDTETLCDMHPAWDTEIPLESVINLDGETRVCRICREKLLDKLGLDLMP